MGSIILKCTNCNESYPDQGVPFRCPICGGLYDYTEPILVDSTRIERFSQELKYQATIGIWRYRHSFSLPDGSTQVSLGEGDTPLVWTRVDGRQIALKCEYLNPTGSFKDRGTAVLVSFLMSRGVKSAIEDSSGNAGASFAAYAARAGIKARVFVPEYASGPKREQIEAYGADVIRIPGPRSNAAEAVKKQADEGSVYASHVYLPHMLPGYATIAYELVDQIGGLPGSIITPVGQGGLLLGIGRGFEALRNAGVISHIPKLIGVQARACAPLWALASYGPAGLGWVSEGETLAEGVRVHRPVRGDEILKMIEQHEGFFIAVDEDEIRKGQDVLARLGFYVEPTSAIVWNGLEQVIDRAPEPIVLVLTGSGLKARGHQ